MTNFNPKILGARIKALRQNRGYTQVQLAELADCSVPYICYIEAGTKCMLLDTLVTIANALQVSADELLQDFLMNTVSVSNHTYVTILEDCTPWEKEYCWSSLRP